ncbi:TPA: fimbria/pilus periplasmic chaperone [Vibrio vulnificus]|nr:fimbria/pilus periplasmic chaperone [Vibrio vulnificus]HDU8768335.1 fimbria/pilus periplasmic chaperone [Vibrio vulnificus]
MKNKKLYLLALASWLFANQVWASLVMDATRYIYKGGTETLTLTVTNNAKVAFGAQMWVENIVENDTRPTFIVTPPFYKIKEESKQVVRVMKVSDHLPTDKESIYWLNLQEIPPKKEGSGLALAIRTRVKLIYRPEGLDAARKGAEQGVKIEYLPGEQWLVNSTPYIFSIGEVSDVNGKPIAFTKADVEKLGMFMPGDRINVTGHKVNAFWSLNDYGVAEEHILKNTKWN